jgi:hypothetical protein
MQKESVRYFYALMLLQFYLLYFIMPSSTQLNSPRAFFYSQLFEALLPMLFVVHNVWTKVQVRCLSQFHLARGFD